jgi:hypothetical protein
MTRQIHTALLTYVSIFLLLSVFAALPARAELISTDQAAPQAPSESLRERDRVKALIARPEVARKLESMGVLPKEVQARVDALTDEEVASLAAKIDALPAGGLSDTNWLLIIIAILLVLIIL